MTVSNPCNWTWYSPLDIWTCANTITGSMFTAGVLFAFFVIFLVSFKAAGRGIETAYAAASFITMTLAYLLTAAGLADPFIPVIPTIAVVTSIFFLYKSNKYQ